MKTFQRQFQTRVGLEPTKVHQWAHEVIGSIENDTIRVFRPDDEEVWQQILDGDQAGGIDLDAGATRDISIREWLPYACQYIRWETAPEEEQRARRAKKIMGTYYCNAGVVLWPAEILDPPGPAAVVAGIALNRALYESDSAPDLAEIRAKFVIAHELAHAIDSMRLIVPAFLDWDAFKENVLSGNGADRLALLKHGRDLYVDDYGSENELAMVQTYWPSRAKTWFASWRE